MNEHLIISDHDGTWTDSVKEHELYREIFFEEYTQITGLPRKTFRPYVEWAENIITSNPISYAWIKDNFIIAPASADHVLLTRASMELATQKWQTETGIRLSISAESLDPLFSELYKKCYSRAGTVYKTGAQELLIDLHKTGKFSLVSSSDTVAVRRRISQLLKGTSLDAQDVSIVGNAKKWHHDMTWEVLDRDITHDTFPWPVILRKPHYASILDSFQKPIGVVTGDIYQLDLAVPEAKNIFTILVTSEMTAPWEYDYYEHHPNGARAGTLFEMRDAIEAKLKECS